MLAEIRASMARQQRTRSEVAKALGIGRGAVQRRLAGDVPFRAGELTALAVYLDVPVSTFYEAASPASASA